MQRITKYLLSGISALLIVAASMNIANAKATAGIKFNEILVHNDSNYVDDFGEHNSWIEIFNSDYSTRNIGGYYLTDDLNNPTKYWIPTGDPKTKLSARGYVIFWADNKSTRGAFHLNFELKDAKVLALFEPDGKKLVDKIDIVQPQTPDVSYGKVFDDDDKFVCLEHSTPGSTNDYSKKVTAGENFVQFDPFGIGMTLIAMSVVFSSLALLYLFFKAMGKYFVRKAKAPVAVKEEGTNIVRNVAAGGEISGEVNAAIAMALYMYQSELHDLENTVLTAQKVSRTYSPWSSKIYALRRYPR